MVALALILDVELKTKDHFTQCGKGFHAVNSNVSCATIFNDVKCQGHLMTFYPKSHTWQIGHVWYL